MKPDDRHSDGPARNGDVTVVNRYGVTDDTARPLGPWVRLYADVVDRKAHYTDRQFRTFIHVLSLAVRLHGVLPSRKALSAREGVAEIDFLISEGDLEESEAGLVVHRWRAYQTDPTNAERQRRYRNAHPALRDVISNEAPSSSSSSSDSQENHVLGEDPPARTREAWLGACPSCGAAPGQPCAGARDKRNGEPWSRWAVHAERRLVAEASGWAYLYPVAVELTGKHAPAGKFAEILCGLAEEAGPEVVIAAMRAVADAKAPIRPNLSTLAWGVENALRRPPPGRQIASAVQDEQERAYTARKAAERAQAKVDRQRRALALVEEFHDA